jgi:AraC-like DNA-binding protein
MRKPFLFEYELNDLFEYSEELAAAFNAKVINNGIQYPQDIASGTSKFFRINDYISFQIVNYTAKEKMTFQRSPGRYGHIVISFQDFSFSKCTVHDFQCNEIVVTNNKIGSIQCKNTRLAETVIIEPGLEARVVIILLKENWLENVLKDSNSKDKFYKYLVNQNANMRKEYLSVEQQRLFCEIIDKQPVSQLENIYYESRVMNLLESFLSDVLQKEETADNYIFCSDEDIKMIQLAEKNITENVMNPFAGVDKLSRLCCMSRTKFINLFHKVYGASSFEYYQKKRLSIAYDMLKSGKYSVTDAANKLGYTGITNFTQAFKRDFGFLPSDLLEEVRSFSKSLI